MAQQLVKRRVFTDAGELIREGMAPKDVPNTRKDLMAWWALEDKRIAEEEAAAAEAAVAALQEPEVVDTTAADLLAVQEAVDGLTPRVADLEQNLEGLTAATPEEIARVGVLLTSASTAALAVEGAALKAMEEITAERDAVVAIGEAVQGEQARVAGEIGQLLADGRQSLEATEAEMLAKTTNAISKRITQFQVEAAQLRGPKGNTGRVGQGLIAGAGKRPEVRPDGHEWAPGDSWLNTKAEGFQLEYMAADGSWSAPVRLVPAPKLINAVQNVIDQAPRQYTSITQTGTGTGGGATKPLVTAIPAGGSALVFESLDAAKRGVVSRAFTAQLLFIVTSGPLTGQSVTLLVSGLLQGASNTAICEYSEVESSGGLAGMCNPTFNAQLGSASDATVRTQTLQVFVGGLTGTAFDGAAIQGWALFTEPK